MIFVGCCSGGSGHEESCGPGGGGGPLQLIVSLLTASPLSLDLTAHIDLLQLAGTLFAGLHLVHQYRVVCNCVSASENCKSLSSL